MNREDRKRIEELIDRARSDRALMRRIEAAHDLYEGSLGMGCVIVKYTCGHEIDHPAPLLVSEIDFGTDGSCAVCRGKASAHELGSHFRVSEPEYQEMITAAAQEAPGG